MLGLSNPCSDASDVRSEMDVIGVAAQLMNAFVSCRKIMAMQRTSQHQDKHNQKSIGFFLQCNAESDSS